MLQAACYAIIGSERSVLPVLFTIPVLNLPIHTYGLMIVVGFLLAVYIAYRQCIQLGKYANDVLDFAFWALVGGLIGARIVFIAVEWREFFVDRPFTDIGVGGVKIPTVFALWQGGLVFYGSIIGGAIAFFLFARKRKLPSFHVADILVLGVPLAQMFGRLGCISAGCCWGQNDFHMDGSNIAANAFYDIQFPPGSSAYQTILQNAPSDIHDYMLHTNHTVPLFPSQLAEALGCAILFVALYFIARQKRFHGQVLIAYAVLYSALRFTLEFFRDDPRGSVSLLSTSQFISLVIVGLAIVAMFWLNKRAKDALAAS